MGSIFSCFDSLNNLERFDYDLTPIKQRSPPIIWLIGPPGSGRRTQGEMLREGLGFSNIKVTDLLRDEATVDSKRGRFLKEAIRSRMKKIPDTMVIDLIKEAMLRESDAKGYIINNFPKSPKQADIFVREIADVDAIFHLYSNVDLLVSRVESKVNGKLTSDTIRHKIQQCSRDVQDCLENYRDRVCKINTHGSPIEVFEVIMNRLNAKLAAKEMRESIPLNPMLVARETDYASTMN